jgi:hypothetical protein
VMSGNWLERMRTSSRLSRSSGSRELVARLAGLDGNGIENQNEQVHG